MASKGLKLAAACVICAAVVTGLVLLISRLF
jgi:hypothetical protein